MALISCPECNAEVSDQAPACPKCGHPIAEQPKKQFTGPPVDCSNCGGLLKKTAEGTSEGSGCIVILLGLLLSPVLIGIPIIIYGIHLMGKTKSFWQCRTCGQQFPRLRRWYELR